MGSSFVSALRAIAIIFLIMPIVCGFVGFLVDFHWKKYNPFRWYMEYYVKFVFGLFDKLGKLCS